MVDRTKYFKKGAKCEWAFLNVQSKTTVWGFEEFVIVWVFFDSCEASVGDI